MCIAIISPIYGGDMTWLEEPLSLAHSNWMKILRASLKKKKKK
jgi:hypothetical protein